MDVRSGKGRVLPLPFLELLGRSPVDMSGIAQAQLKLFPETEETFPERVFPTKPDLRSVLAGLLEGDLDFQGARTGYASHSLHPFAAKFPPQLPRVFIQALTDVGDTVLDPMVGSGTTAVEAVMLERKSIGVDLDPLAVRLTSVKTSPLDPGRLRYLGRRLLSRARQLLDNVTLSRFDDKTRKFIDYWFPVSAQKELMALAEAIEEVESPAERRFFELVFSATIIAKSGSVSLARDLSHSRPHRDLNRKTKSPLTQFSIRLEKSIRRLSGLPSGRTAWVLAGDARSLPLKDGSIDLIVTSPPYANAIDYMRAHKFSLVWFGHTVDELSEVRARYIGSERTKGFTPGQVPGRASEILQALQTLDRKKARVLRKYFTEMEQVLREMLRVLREGRAAVVVVGTSTMRGLDVQTHVCIADIARAVGFDVVGIAQRKLDRDRRMMPTSFGGKSSSQIEQRMHSEFVIGLVKPEEGGIGG